jgi:hypothetical protein
VAWQLAEAGYTVELDVWDWAAGRNFVTAISDALERCDRVVALFSAAYFDRSRYTTGEWSAALVHMPDVAEGKLVPVRVEEVPAGQVPAVLRPLVCRDLFGGGRGAGPTGAAGGGGRAAAPGRQAGVPAAGNVGGAEQAGRCRAAAAGDDAAGLEHPGA